MLFGTVSPLARAIGLMVMIGALMAQSASAGRSIKEADLLKKTIKKAPAGELKKIVAAHKEMNDCKDLAIHSREFQGTVCRLQALQYLVKGSKQNTPWLVNQKATLAQAAFQTLVSIDKYDPLDPPPHFRDLQYRAAEATCQTIQNVMNDLSAIKNKGGWKPAFKAAQNTIEQFPMNKSTTGLREAVCACSKIWLRHADKALKSMEEKGAIQRILTSRGCFLDMKKAKKALSTSRKAGPIQLSGRAQEVAEQESDNQRIIDYAQTRDFTLNRCRTKIGASKLSNPEKVQKCLCREITRWRFPQRKDAKNVISAVLPIEEKMLGLRVNVNPKGKVLQCGPLEGPKAPPLKTK